MPQILSYTPAWLAHGSPGCDMFTPPQVQQDGRPTTSSAADSGASATGARRVLAQRGTELFVAVGNTIRWADLALLKDGWETQQALEKLRSSGQKQDTDEDDLIEGQSYKVLKVAVHGPIRQLIPSPNENLLAVVTSHTVHIAIIPDSSHLDQPDTGPLKVRTYMLGPTIHVLSQSSVVCVLWHPLGATGDSIVTVTEDAVVRLWELNVNNRATFEQPTIDLDLSKLHYAESAQDPVTSHRMGSNRGFSVDRLGMRAAAAAFGGSGNDTEHGWSPMTLWVAMTEGDVFALCPLLPTKWRSPAALVPSLTTTVLAKKAYAEGSEAHEEEQRVFSAQLQWLTDVDEQEPVYRLAQDTAGYNWRMPIYDRPTAVSFIPKLQGPFRILPGDVEDDLDLSSIHVIPPRLNTEELLGEGDEDFADVDQEGLSTTVVCLLSSSGRVYITLCLEEIEGQWLPLQNPTTKPRANPDAQPELILLEALDTLRPGEEAQSEWPTITPDFFSRYAFFVTHTKGVFYFSIEPWLKRLEDELQSEEPTGTSFRMAVLTKGASTVRDRLLRFEHLAGTPIAQVTSALIFLDSDLGYFLLTAQGSRPQAAVLEQPGAAQAEVSEPVDTLEATSFTPPAKSAAPQLTAPPRQPFQPPAIFWEQRASLAQVLQNSVAPRQRALLQSSGPLRLTADTLEVLTAVHRELSGETHALGTAAAELFRRCERLTAELSDQVRRVRDSAARIDALLGEDADVDDDYEQEQTGPDAYSRLAARLSRAQDRTAKLHDRHAQLRLRLSHLGARPLSDVEVAWKAEVDRMNNAIESDAVDHNAEDGMHASLVSMASSKKGTRASLTAGKMAWMRFEEAKTAAQDLLREAKSLRDDTAKDDDNEEPESEGNDASVRLRKSVRSDGGQWSVPAEVRRGRMAQVMSLLDRETAMVEAAQERLARLSVVDT